jgi:hypothetical protein
MSTAKSKFKINNDGKVPAKVYTLSEFEKTIVEAGLADVAQGKTFSSAEADRILKKWLNK